VLRMSVGIYNDIGDVDRTVELVGSWARTNTARSVVS
jgi:selenocysteine lyase/cysteine desulfurase